jgi:N-methylhydantoinase A
MSYSLAVDIGGTFTDVVLRSADGVLTTDKTLTTHEDLLEGLFRGVHQVLRKADISPGDIDGVVVHATTIVTNALIERKGAPTALITTKGFGDVLAIRNEHRYEMYDPQIEFAEPLIPRDLTFEIDERTLADGSILREVDAAEISALAAALRAKGVVSAAICLLNSFRNPTNEQAVAAILKAAIPDLYLSLSSTIAPQIREYPRTSTTAINAYTSPITEPYLRALAVRLAQMKVPNKPLIMLSSGGIIGAEVAARNPVRMIESGPAAGALAATYYAERLGLDRLLSFDMGGTTAKACLIEDRKPLIARQFRGRPDVSLLRRQWDAANGPVDRHDRDWRRRRQHRQRGQSGLAQGRTAQRGIESRTGLLWPRWRRADRHRCRSGSGPARRRKLPGRQTCSSTSLRPRRRYGVWAMRLGTNLAQTAGGVYRVVAETMAAAARTHATDRGVDHRGLPLLAFGGAGPVHACAVGELLQSTAVIFPPHASVLSAFGTLVTSVRFDLVRSAPGMLDALDWGDVDHVLTEMSDEGLEALREAGCGPEQASMNFGADLRYFGQQNEFGDFL